MSASTAFHGLLKDSHLRFASRVSGEKERSMPMAELNCSMAANIYLP